MQRRTGKNRLFVAWRSIRRRELTRKARVPRDKCACVGRSSIPEDWVVSATGIEPVTPSMSTRCLKPKTLRLLEFLKTFVVFFAVCSRRIVAVHCRERVSFFGVGGSDWFAKRSHASDGTGL
jgi:hypothetical protein